MAKRIEDLPQPKPQLTLVEKSKLVSSACNHGDFDPKEKAHVFSHASEKYFCDIVCMVNEEAEWHGELVKVDGDVMTVEAYQTLEEVEEYVWIY